MLDLYPTLTDLCGLPARDGLEGHSLRPLLKDAKAERPWPALTTHGPGNHAVRTEQLRYIRYADGSEELSVQRGASADAVLGGLTAEGLGVDTVSADPAAPVAGTTAGVQQTVYRTTSGSQDRTTWLRIVPGGEGVWQLRLTVPGDTAEATSADLFTAIARGFTVTGA